ncbi:GNAT family N-acetyltransferase [Paraburkholderia sp. SARCC-3016]|uniref:GNAT family N-acetyltransferase n=1 Tax=Paraburkholderia sp. SARCC-3016 TaxID=3058611 RepID=UPI0035BE42ED
MRRWSSCSRDGGNGVGHALLLEAERFCKESDCSKMMLLSSTHRIHAHHFFERAGFRADRKRGFGKYRSQFFWLFEVYRRWPATTGHSTPVARFSTMRLGRTSQRRRQCKSSPRPDCRIF